MNAFNSSRYLLQLSKCIMLQWLYVQYTKYSTVQVTSTDYGFDNHLVGGI